MSVIQLENVTKIYTVGEVETRALDGVSLTIEAGEFTALVGPSGSGKTTMLQLMGCLDRPNRGSVKINERDVTRFNANQRADLRRERIGFIFQFFALVPVLTAYENVELPLLLNGVLAGERQERVLADEPTANLDTANDTRAMEIMRRLNEQTGTAFIFATHDPRVVSFARRVVKMQDGRVADDGLLNNG